MNDFSAWQSCLHISVADVTSRDRFIAVTISAKAFSTLFLISSVQIDASSSYLLTSLMTIINGGRN